VQKPLNSIDGLGTIVFVDSIPYIRLELC